MHCVDKILGTREALGALRAETYFVTRTWSGERPGDGTFSDSITKVEPQPGIKDLSHDIRLQEGGAIKQGDLLLTGFSQNQYTEDDLKTQTNSRNIEKFLKVGEHYYSTIHVKQNLITWDIQVRKILQDESNRR